jgi:hypothetical protein
VKEFWVSSGHHLTSRRPDGRLAASDELILAYLARPELMPPADACDAERGLHAALLREPRRAVADAELDAVRDDDARENWQLMIRFRDRLTTASSIEAAYLELVRSGAGQIPPLFFNHLVHLILRNILDGCDDPYVLRAAELFFRAQRVSFHDGTMLLADAEAIEEHEAARHASPLLEMLGRPAVTELDVLDDASAYSYWSRSDAFTMVFNIGSNPTSRRALARVIEMWVRHLLGISTSVEPVAKVHDDDWRWFVGLDAEGTRIGNALWRNEAISGGALSRVVALFRLMMPEDVPVAVGAAGKPIYLILGMTADHVVRIKPQNLITGLPLARPGPEHG